MKIQVRNAMRLMNRNECCRILGDSPQAHLGRELRLPIILSELQHVDRVRAREQQRADRAVERVTDLLRGPCMERVLRALPLVMVDRDQNRATLDSIGYQCTCTKSSSDSKSRCTKQNSGPGSSHMHADDGTHPRDWRLPHYKANSPSSVRRVRSRVGWCVPCVSLVPLRMDAQDTTKYES